MGLIDLSPNTLTEFYNKAIEIALAEQEQPPANTGFEGLTNLEIAAEVIEREMIRQSEKAIQEFDAMETDLAKQEQPLISADEARKLGAGNAEFRYRVGGWWVCDKWCVYNSNADFQYRAIKQPEPIEPHAELKANLVKLNGKLMPREAAIAEWESKKDTCDLLYRSEKTKYDRNEWSIWNIQGMDEFALYGGEYELRERPLKQISWKDMPVGVMTTEGELRSISTNNLVWVESKNSNYGSSLAGHSFDSIELVPADQQPWIAVQDEFTPANGLIYKFRHGLASQITMNETVIAFKVTDIAKGWVLK